MSEEKKATAAKSEKPAPAAAEELLIRVKVLKNGGLQIGGGTAGRGAVVNVYQSAAKFHEDRKEIEILGTV